MIHAISYIIAVIITCLLAVILYPVAALFWLFGLIGRLLVRVFELFGKISENMFKFTTKAIRSLWNDLKGVGKNSTSVEINDNFNNETM